MARYSIYIEKELEEKLDIYMKQYNIAKKSLAIKDCMKKILYTYEFDDSMYNIDQKLNRILYRQNQHQKLTEQLFANFGFGINYEVGKDELLKELYERNNKYIGRFD